MGKLIAFLSSKTASLLCVSAAMVARCIQLIYFYNTRFDGSYQVIGTHNLVTGNGITIDRVYANDLSQIIYEPLVNWPPGYSLILSPFYALTGHDHILAGIILDILASFVLIFICRKILKLFKVEQKWINVFTLFNGLFIYYFYFIASSDSVAISIFVSAIYFFLRLILKGFERRSFFIMTVLLMIAGLIKYLFIPLVFLLPLVLFLFGKRQDRQVFNWSVLSAILLVVFFSGLLLWQKSISGTAAYISEPGRGFFPEHLLKAYPFIPSSFVNPDSLADITGMRRSVLFSWRIIHFILFLVLLVWAIRDRNWLFNNRNGYPALLFLLMSLGITSILAVLSVLVEQEEILPGYLWTYIEEPRYYGLLNVMIHLGVIIMISLKGIKRWMKTLLLLLLLPGFIQGTVFTFNRLVNYKNEKYSWQKDLELQRYADALIIGEKKDKTVAVTGSSYYINNKIASYSHVPVFNEVFAVNSPDSMKASRTMMLLCVIPAGDTVRYQSFLARKPLFAGEANGFYFYKQYVEPRP